MKYALIAMALVLTGCAGIRAPRSDVPFTYPIGWWPYQQDLKIHSLKVTQVDSLRNIKTLIAIEITGEVKGSPGWRPYVSEVHLSERVLRGGNFAGCLAEIVITPVIDVKLVHDWEDSPVPFSIRQEMILHTMGWGDNTYTIICGEQRQMIKVAAHK